MIVGERTNSERSQNRSLGDSRDRDREKDYRYERDREYRGDRDRENERGRGRNICTDQGNNSRSVRERKSRSRERERSGRNVETTRETDRSRGRSPYGSGNYENDSSKRQNSSRLSPNNQDAMSGLTALENIRDRGVSRSPVREATGNDKYRDRGPLNFLPQGIQVRLKKYINLGNFLKTL